MYESKKKSERSYSNTIVPSIESGNCSKKIKHSRTLRLHTYPFLQVQEKESSESDLDNENDENLDVFSESAENSVRMVSIHSDSSSISSSISEKRKQLISRVSDYLILTTAFPNVSYWNMIYIIVVLFACVLFSSPLILFPMHDQIENPGYWWETMIHVNLSYTLSSMLVAIYECKIIFKDVFFKFSLKTFIKMYTIVAILDSFLFSMIYVYWTLYRHKIHPFAFVGAIGGFILISIVMVLWFEFPSNLRRRSTFKKRFFAFACYFLWTYTGAMIRI